MCGRFCLDSNLAAITEYFSLKQGVVLKPRFNIAPSQVIPVIRHPGTLEFITWGLRPSWLKTEHNSFINARIETLTEKPAFKQALQKRRCLVIANGYYEWKQIGKIKQPFFISLPQRELFAFAGIWEGDTCAIITTEALHPELKSIHERAPVVLTHENCKLWLNATTDINSVLNTIIDVKLPFNIAAVSTYVNSPQHDSVACIQSLQ